MHPIIKKYCLTISGVFITSQCFVACGAEYYQTPLHGDIDERPSEDGTQATPGIHALHGWRTIPIKLQFGANLSKNQVDQIKKALTTWSYAIGRPQSLFQYVDNADGTTGDSFNNLYSSLKDSFNGQYSDLQWAKTKKADYVLATTIWEPASNDSQEIVTADIRYNFEYYWMGDSFVGRNSLGKSVVDLESLALHEVGHFLGLSHIGSDVDDLSIMNPALFIGEGLTSRNISKGDIHRIQSIYGCVGDACDVDKLHETLELQQLDEH